jgi:O-antigen/teichoic acid export membrane protein
MKMTRLALAKGVGWTVGAHILIQLLRFATNIALAWLLAPELLGIMLVVNSLRTGIDLVSDVGIGQNIVHNRDAEHPKFYNTAWTLQLLRGLLLWIGSCAVALPLAHFYHASILSLVLPVAGLYFVLIGLTSVSRFLLQKRMQIAKLNAFEIIVAAFSAVAHVILAYLYPTIWALVIGGLVACAATMIGSYFLIPDIHQRLYIFKPYARQIVVFGKWIFLSSIVYFMSINFDALYLAKVIPLDLLGVYGIARTLSDALATLALRLSSVIVFPLIASSFEISRESLREQLASSRLALFLVAGFGLSIFAAIADVLVAVLYDQRYHAATWMLPVLLIGVWFSIMSSINESTLLGFGKPLYGAIGNGLKFGFLVIGLPLGYMKYGVVGAVIAVGVSDLCRYAPILVGQIRERFSFARQDLFLTLAVFGLIAFCEWLRWDLGFGTSFDGVPIIGSIFDR